MKKEGANFFVVQLFEGSFDASNGYLDTTADGVKKLWQVWKDI